MRRAPLATLLFLVVFLIVGITSDLVAAPAPVAVIEVEGAITPVTVRLVSAAVERAQAERAQALVIQLDTPGGLERSMRSIVQSILNSEVPVIVYVAPTGGRAASAGVFITMAAHVAAAMMASPAASPSRPSMRLNAFVSPTIHSSVTGTASHPSGHVAPKSVT